MAQLCNFQQNFLSPTYFCNHGNSEIKSIAQKLEHETQTQTDYVKNAFYFVRDTIRFGIDLWQKKASETLSKGYGACYNKNLLMIALLRNKSIPCRLQVNPMKNSFVKPSAGNAYKTLSNPFFHCYTDALLDGKWISLDPTLDKKTFQTFFKPLDLNWSIEWNDNGMEPLYSESITGPPVTISDIDSALRNNLKSHFLFKYEPNILLRLYAGIGNKNMWEKIGVLS